MEQYTYKICPKFDKPCKDLKIVWVGTEGLIVPCEEAGCLTVSLDPNSAVHCLEFYIFCDECASCPPIYVKRCFCNSDTDCEDCETCNEFGICEPLCKVNEFCDGDKCCECNETTPCTNGAKCLDCKCVCPQGTFKSNGKCVECDGSTPLTKCQECIDGKIVDKVCDGACDPLTGQCVDCLISGDCAKRTDGKTCCVNKQCVCCAGTVWSASQQRCIPIPCTDESCGPCKRCTESGCVEVICPDGYKCVNDVCVPWPCKDVSCENGAECGEGCGCIEFEGIKQCVPCYLLNCPGSNSIYPACSGALGCVCNGSNCEGVNHCGQDCDSFNPCTEPGCTCYENKCVNCANFPCTTEEGGCTSYTGCDCPNGKCEGADCTDKLELTKKQDCTTKNGCELKAELTTKGCKCDTMTFKVQNIATATCNPASATSPTDPTLTFDVEGDSPATIADILKLKIGLFKKYLGADKQYSKYLTDVAFGDNELVTGNIKVTVEHYYYNNGNILTKADDFTKTVTKSVNKNLVAPISLTANDIKSVITIGGKQVNTYVKIIVNVSNVSVVNNNCIQYDSNKELVEYILDYTTSGNAWDTCNRINTEYQGIFSVKLNDDKSSRKPLFIWSKSNTSTFDTNGGAFNNASGTYSQHGWFRKEYGTKEGSKWIDKINSPEDYNTYANGELVPNYNYKVMTDCACANNIAFQNELKFCCPNYVSSITECATKIDLQGFKVCAANGWLNAYEKLPNYNISNINQTYYKLKLSFSDGSVEDINLNHNVSDPTFVTGYSKKYTTKSIVAAEVYQSYLPGGLLSDRECVVSLPIDAVSVPKVQAITDCGSNNSTTATVNLSVTLTPGLTITSTELLKVVPITTGTPIANPPLQTWVGLPVSITVNKDGIAKKLKFTYSNGCMDEVDITNCKTTVVPDPITPTSSIGCPGGIGGAFQALTTGFNQSLPITYSVEGGNLSQPLENTTGIFNNLPAGEYILTARQEGTQTASTSFTVVDLGTPDISIDKTVVCPGEFATITINADSGSVFEVKKNGVFLSNVTVPISGIYTIPGLTTTGTDTYTVKLITDPNNSYCLNYTETLILTSQGQTVALSITLGGATNYCVGQPVPFRIGDNGIGGTYNISYGGGGTGPATLQATISGFNGSFIPSTTSATITATGVSGSCNTVTPASISVTASALPVVSSTSQECIGSLHNITVIASGATQVKIDNVIATESPTGTFKRVNLTYAVGTSVPIEVINANNCVAIPSPIIIDDCDCPSGTVSITSTGNTCGPGSATIQFSGDTLGINGVEWTYVFQQMMGIDYVNIGVETLFPAIPLSPAPTVVIPTSIGETKFVRLRATNQTTGCFYDSTPVSFTALSQPSGFTITPSTSLPVNTNTPISFSTQSGTGGPYTFAWSGNVTGNTNVSVPMTFTTPGNKTATVTVCSAIGCCQVVTLPFEVVQSCSPISIGTPSFTSCSDITVSASGGTGALTYQVFGSTITIASTPVPGNGTIIIPTSSVLNGEADNIVLVVTDSTGLCSENKEISYSRCSCVCNNSVCDTTFNQQNGGTNGVNDLIGTFPTGTIIKWGFIPLGVSDRMIIKENGVTILDTGSVSAYSSCTCTSILIPTVCSGSDLYLGDEVGNTIALNVGTGTVSSNTFSVCPTDALEVQSVVVDTINGLSCELGGTLTLSGTGDLRVQITANTSGGNSTQWRYLIGC